MRSAQKTAVVTAISFIKVIVWGESLGFLACALDVRFQNTPKSSRWKPKKHRLPG